MKWWKVLILDNFSYTTFRPDALIHLRVKALNIQLAGVRRRLFWAYVLTVQSRMWSGRAGSTPKLPVRGDPAVGYVVTTVAIEVRAIRCRAYADSFLYD